MTNKELYFELRGVIADVEQGDGFDDVCLETIKRVADALAKPEPDPVAQVDYNERGNIQWLFGKQIPDKTFLYTAPPQRIWQGLTDEDIEDACWTEVDQRLRSFARAIETRLKNRNT